MSNNKSNNKSNTKSITKAIASMSVNSSSKSLSSKNSDDVKTFNNLPDDMLLEIMIQMDDESLKKFITLSKKNKELFTKNKKFIMIEKFKKYGNISNISSNIWNVSWSPDSSKIVTGHDDGSICIWNTNTGELLRTLEGHTDQIKSVAWSPKGDEIASAGVDDKVYIWNVKTGKKNYEVEEIITVNSVIWNNKGTKLAIGGVGVVDILDLDTLSHSQLEAGLDFIFSIAWSPDGSKIVAGGRDKMIRIWDITTGEIKRVLRGHKLGVSSVAWSPDGTKIVSASQDQIIRIWNADTGKRMGILRGHTDMIWSVAWNPESNKIVSGSDDKTIRIWDINTKQVLRMYEDNENSIESVAWSPDGTKIASTSYNRAIRILNISDLLQHGGKTILRRKTIKKT